MLSKRSLPTGLFASPDFFELSSDTVRMILIGVILHADDEGRGDAHPHLLARQLDKQPEEIGPALEELEGRGILRCYQVLKRAYYVLTHWRRYQKISRPTPSHYPAPPDEGAEEPGASDERRSRAETTRSARTRVTEDGSPIIKEPEAEETLPVDTDVELDESLIVPAEEYETGTLEETDDEPVGSLAPEREQVTKRKPTLTKRHRKSNPRRRKAA